MIKSELRGGNMHKKDILFFWENNKINTLQVSSEQYYFLLIKQKPLNRIKIKLNLLFFLQKASLFATLIPINFNSERQMVINGS